MTKKKPAKASKKPKAPPPPKQHSTDEEMGVRIDAAEDYVCAGLTRSKVERQLATDYGVSQRQARRYISDLYARWAKLSPSEAPWRREKLVRMAERFFAKAQSNGDYKAAATALGVLAKLSTGFIQHDPDRMKRLVEFCGPRPSDPAQFIPYAQKCMLFELAELMTNTAIDPERRLRWVVEFASKSGFLDDKSKIAKRLADLETLVLQLQQCGEADGDTTSEDDDAEGLDERPPQSS